MKSIFDNTNNKIYCCNCGKINHTYKDCILPKISLGIVLYTFINNKLNFLLVRRKDSIGYIDFLRGKYMSNDIDYIINLFSSMTKEEIQNLKTLNFDKLWEKLWMKNIDDKKFKKDYSKSNTKFNKIQKGYFVDNKYISIDYFIGIVNNFWNETEWGIPKGRRNFREKDIDTAKREFIEESGLSSKCFKIINNKTFIEEYIGSNNMMYRHIYYVAKYIGSEHSLKTISIKNNMQAFEISKIGFYTLKKCNNLIRHYHKEKKKNIIRYL
jgi:ADP-ribose pyrophosphatase YjhB (NUDIX family)